MKQTSFGFMNSYKKEFGGSLLFGKRKQRRPLSTKHPIHLVIKSDEKNLFFPGNRSLEKLIQSTAKEFNIKLYDLALNWSHIHFLIQLKDRNDYVKFIRALTSRLAGKIRLKKPDLEAVFSLRPFTRIIDWGRDFHRVLEYLVLNQMEGRGLVRRMRKKRRKSNISSSPKFSTKPKP